MRRADRGGEFGRGRVWRWLLAADVHVEVREVLVGVVGRAGFAPVAHAAPRAATVELSSWAAAGRRPASARRAPSNPSKPRSGGRPRRHPLPLRFRARAQPLPAGDPVRQLSTVEIAAAPPQLRDHAGNEVLAHGGIPLAASHVAGIQRDREMRVVA